MTSLIKGCRNSTPTRIRFPASFLVSNCFDGRVRMKSPSVTGEKPKVPKEPDSDTVALAFCSTEVSALTKQRKVAAREGVELLVQPAALANA